MHPVVKDFLNYLDVERNAAQTTIDRYRRVMGNFLQFVSAIQNTDADSVDLHGIRRQTIRRYFAHCRDLGNQPQTINHKLTVLKSFFRFAGDSEEWASPNPVKQMPYLKQAKTLPVYLTLSELELLLKSVQQTSKFPERDYAIFLVFAQCGCRFSELLSLTLESVNWEAKTLRVFGKGRKERIIPLTDRTVLALQNYLKIRRPAVNTQSLFLNNQAGPLGPDTLRKLFTLAVARSPLRGKGITPHKLRHTLPYSVTPGRS